MKNILVTGGLGFIGSHLVESLIRDKNNNVWVIDNLSSQSSTRKNKRLADNLNYVILDIRSIDTFDWNEKLNGETFDIIYHLAALARIQPSFDNPIEYISNNSDGTAIICEFARRHGAGIVYAGSSSFYAGPYKNPYAFSKWQGEELIIMYDHIFKVSSRIARFFNVYGHRQPTEGTYATVIGIFERQTKEGMPLTVTGDGEQRRDFTHVSDIVAGLEILGNDIFKWEKQYETGTVRLPPEDKIYNIGTGENYSINDVAKMFSNTITYIESRPGEAAVTLADNYRLRKMGWKPIISIRDYIEEYTNNLSIIE